MRKLGKGILRIDIMRVQKSRLQSMCDTLMVLEVVNISKENQSGGMKWKWSRMAKQQVMRLQEK